MGIEVCLVINVTSHWDFAYNGVSVLEVRDSIREGERLPISDDVTKGMKKLITSCWAPNPKHRLDFKEILETLSSLDASLDATISKPISNKMQSTKYTGPFLFSDRLPVSICGVKVKRNYLIAILFLVILLAVAVFATVYTLASRQRKSTDPSDTFTNATTSVSATTALASANNDSVPIIPTPSCNASTILPEVSTIIQDTNGLISVRGIVTDNDDNIYTLSNNGNQVLKLSIGNQIYSFFR